jgi:hypothetical protein
MTKVKNKRIITWPRTDLGLHIVRLNIVDYVIPYTETTLREGDREMYYIDREQWTPLQHR